MLSEVFPTVGDHLYSGEPGFFQTAGFSPWDTQENPFLFTQQEPVFSFSCSGSDNSTPKTNTSDDGATNPPEEHEAVVDERKRRRMISNRESARRSRMRKQKHLENLRNELNRFKTGNRELTNRLRFVNRHGQILREENRSLRSESVMLQQKLWEIRQVLIVGRRFNHQLIPSAWPCNNNVTTNIYEQNPPSLIT
ncbi:hypothetical protein L6452_44265 [Arctium lappa]|uniref:Uncharacterized protein n=1 Tax=Arctium lappa TaxID=4217 RepID=A0ACB8XGD0_ARCLA|nr:hypothetical protein L6452_44265 [Arctium lappa]